MKRENISAGVRLCTHKTEKFKNSIVSLTLAAPLDEEASVRALLINLLARTNKNLKTITEMNRALAGLYGAVLTPSAEKIGETHLLTLTLLCVDDRFALEGEKVLEEGIKLLCTCLFSPDVTPEGFRQENIAREKRLLIEKIESRKDDKRLYALDRMTENMCRNERYSIKSMGKREDIEKVTASELLDCWKKLLITCPVQINVTGSFDEKRIEKIFTSLFDSLKRDKSNMSDLHTEFITQSYESNCFKEKQRVNQGKLVMGMRAGMTYGYDNYAAIKVMCTIFGGGTFSKLFMNVREKMSLCYYCSARLINHKGIIIVESGIETENAQKALDAIRNELEDIKKGNFTDEVIENAKKSITDSLNSVRDGVLTINEWLKSQCINGDFRTPESFIDEINSVSREEIILAAQMVSEDTVFILEGTREEE